MALIGQIRKNGWILIVLMALACSVIVLVSLRSGVARGWKGAREFLRRLPKGAALERSLDACRRFGKEPFFLTRILAVSI
ncbi:MAG TPA: hypothetical protein PK858_07475, partial [Saprospiraceae bacterium]|nr:hypothetical protein [Saprospiraceae bacterium]